MKIALITDVIHPFTIGGSEIRNYEVAKRLVKMGHEVHILGAKLWDGQNDLEVDGIKIHGLAKYERLYKKNGRRSVLDPVFLSIKTFFHLLKNKYDVADVTAFTFFSCYSAWLACLIKKTPFVLTWQQYFGDYLQGYFGKIKGAIAQTLEFLSTKLTKNHLAVSNFVKSELIGRGVSPENIKIIYNGADLDFISKIPEQQKIYDLMFAGRLNYQKNLPLLIDAALLLKKNFPNIKIAIAGKGEEEENLKKMVEKKGLKNNFYFLGAITDKEQLFKTIKSAKIFVLTSLLEGFPLTAVEANACGLPVVAVKTKHNNIEEFIKNGKNGLVCRAEAENLSESILSLLKTSYTPERQLTFGWNTVAKQQENYYLHLVGLKDL